MFYNSLTDNSLVSGISSLNNWIGNSLFGSTPAPTDINNYISGPFTGGTSYNEAINNGFGKPNATPVAGNWNNQINNGTDGSGLNMGTIQGLANVAQGISGLYSAWSQNKLAKQYLNQMKQQFAYNVMNNERNYQAGRKTYNNNLAQVYESAATQNTGNRHAYDNIINERSL